MACTCSWFSDGSTLSSSPRRISRGGKGRKAGGRTSKRVEKSRSSVRIARASAATSRPPGSRRAGRSPTTAMGIRWTTVRVTVMSTWADPLTESTPTQRTRHGRIRTSLLIPSLTAHLEMESDRNRLLREKRRERRKGDRLLDRPQGRLVQEDIPRNGHELDVTHQTGAQHREAHRHPLHLPRRQPHRGLDPPAAHLRLDRREIVAQRRIRLFGVDAALH